MSHGPQRNPISTYTSLASQVAYPITFPFLNAADLIVSKAGTVITTGFTITGGNGGLGALTLSVAPTTGSAVIVSSKYSQDTTNAMIRRWNDLGNPIDGPLSREMQMVNGNNPSFPNQTSQKRNVASKTGSAVAVAGGVFPSA